VRLAPLRELFGDRLTAADLEAILGALQALGYLQSGRPGEWRAGARLNQLVDLQATEHAPFSLHSNLAVSNTPPIKIRDQYSQRVVASVDRQWFDRDLLTLEGRPLNVEWADGDSLWVSAYRGADAAAHLRYLSSRQVLSYDLARRLAAQVGLAAVSAPLVAYNDGWLWFHWLGDVYGRAALDLLRYTLGANESPQPGVCLALREELRALPVWTADQVTRYLHDQYRRYESLLALGAYHHLLPTELRRRAVVAQFDVPRFLDAVGALQITRAPEGLGEALQDLVGGSR
jgi:hypothetical protein